MPKLFALSDTIKNSLTVILTFTRIAFNDWMSFFGLAIFKDFAVMIYNTCERSEQFLLAKTWLAS